MSQESSSEEESLNVLSVQSDSKSDSKEDDQDEVPIPKVEKKKKKKKSKHSKSRLEESREGEVRTKKKLKSKLLKGKDKLHGQEKTKDKKSKVPLKGEKSPKIEVTEKKVPVQDKKPEKKLEDKPFSIDKSKLRYSQTNLAKIITKPLYDRNAEESISNILNRKPLVPKSPVKSPSKTTSFTTKSYIDKSAAIIEADQTIKFKDQKPVITQRISPEKMTKSVDIIVKHLYKNKKSLDINQLTQQDSKSIIKFSLSSFINEEGERFD